MEIKMTPVPPPAEAPIDKRAQALGLVRGLRVEATDSQYRCCDCGKMQPPDSILVWVPDGIFRGDPGWSIEERCREAAYNGHWSAVCMKCAPKSKENTRENPWWKFW